MCPIIADGLHLQDLDYPNPLDSFWGEVQANIHGRLGCVGTMTNGGVRDLDEMEGLQFNAFASSVLVSHGYIHIADAGAPVTVGGLLVNPGDIILRYLQKVCKQSGGVPSL